MYIYLHMWVVPISLSESKIRAGNNFKASFCGKEPDGSLAGSWWAPQRSWPQHPMKRFAFGEPPAQWQREGTPGAQESPQPQFLLASLPPWGLQALKEVFVPLVQPPECPGQDALLDLVCAARGGQEGAGAGA